MKTPPVDIRSEDFGAILTCAVRYAAGRATYMPGLVRNFIRPLIPGLSNNTLFVLARDIGEHEDADPKETTEWKRLLSAIEQEQFNRGYGVSDR